MLTIRYAAAFPRMRITSVDPGFTATDFNDHRGMQTVEQGAAAIVRYALITRRPLGICAEWHVRTRKRVRTGTLAGVAGAA